MNCPICAGTNSKDALYCNNCGEPLTASAAAALREKERREQRTREIELTEKVATRLMNWAKVFLFFATASVTLLVFIVGKASFDIPKAVERAKADVGQTASSGITEIDSSRQSALSDIANLRTQLTPLKSQVDQARTDVIKYQQVNEKIAELQSQLKSVQGQVLDLGQTKLKVGAIESTGTGPPAIGLGLAANKGSTGCSLEKLGGSAAAYCVTGSPLALNQMTPDGRVRPVASFSDIGFQDLSTLPRSECKDSLRGTLYVEKETGHQADKAFLCVKADAGTFRWLQIATLN
jgi:hypothetical protein